MSRDLVERQEIIDRLDRVIEKGLVNILSGEHPISAEVMKRVIEDLPSAEPEIIRCNSCKHWTQSTGKMKGYGLGRCDFLDADLVTCNGFCYWAERKEDVGESDNDNM